MRISLLTKQIFLHGDAEIKFVQTELKAEYIRLDMDKKEAFAIGKADTAGKLTGSPKFKDGSQAFDSKELRYNFNTGRGFVKNIIMQQGEGFLQGKLTKKMTDDIYCVQEGWYTTCDQHDHPHFYINMNRAVMIRDKKIVTEWAQFYMLDVPTPLFIPFGYFPISKSGTSGLIMPTWGDEKMRGYNLRNGGYYFAINDYVDASLIGDLFMNGSWAATVSSNYKYRYHFSGTFNFSISRNHTGEERLPSNYRESKDWSLRWTHTQDPKADPYSTISASVDMSSSTNSYYNATSISDIANQRKGSSIAYSKKWPDQPFSLSATFNHNQNSRDTTLTMSFPNLNFKMSTIYPLRKKGKATNLKFYDNIGISYSAEIANSLTEKEYKFFDAPLTQWSNGFRHSIPISPSISLVKDVSLSPSFNYTGVAFLNSIRKNWVDTTAGNGGGYLKIDTIHGLQYAHNYSTALSFGYNPTVYGMFMFKEGSKIAAIRHVIRPSASLSFSPTLGVPRGTYTGEYTDGSGRTQKYSYFEGKKYSIPETPEKANGSMSFSLNNNVEMKLRNDKDTTGKEEFKKYKLLESFNISTNYNLFADSLNWSNISLSARTSLFDGKLGLNFSGTIDPYYLNQNNTKINKFSGGIGRLTSVTFSTGYSFSSDKGKKKEEKNELVGGFYDKYMDFEVPWTFSFDYSLNMSTIYTRNEDPGATRAKSERKMTQNLRANGDFSLTQNWKIGFSTGYDFDKHEITATSMNLSRDLHCWDMTFSCIPFGTHQSYNFQINVRSSLLKDLKLTKRSSFYDGGY
ncbi:hypothetical protein FACS1894121_0500 [Bacteroidia bacterium]|nr:hypothetical protein FACS1894121_0500 [Bacteroidia bacterium]